MTTTTDDTLALVPVPVPRSIADADLRTFGEVARLCNTSWRHHAGHANFDTTALEMIPSWVDRSDRLHAGVIARSHGISIGCAIATIPLEKDAANIEFELCLEPGREGDGVEDRLIEAMEQTAREHGRDVVQAYTLHRPDVPGPRLEAPTGAGSIPAADPQTRVMRAHGYELKQVERNSILPLPLADSSVRAMRDHAARIAGADYRVVLWTSPTPEEYRSGYALALSRMSTDVPAGDLVWPEESWDPARVARRDAELADAGLTLGVALAIHIPTGSAAAYTELAIGADPRGASRQWGTLVMREHRGRRLGTLVKCENLLRWGEVAARSPRVSTFNAEENRYMLDVNEAIGFVPASYAGAWQKRLM